MNDVVATLMAARELLSDPARWTKGTMARRADGSGTVSDDAVCWCSEGAIMKCALSYNVKLNAKRRLSSILGQPVSIFNDNSSTTHADILAAFDRAIESATRS